VSPAGAIKALSIGAVILGVAGLKLSKAH